MFFFACKHISFTCKKHGFQIAVVVVFVVVVVVAAAAAGVVVVVAVVVVVCCCCCCCCLDRPCAEGLALSEHFRQHSRLWELVGLP